METLPVANLEPADNPRPTGTALATKVRKMSIAQRAALAARLVRCEVSIVGLIPTQAAMLTKVGIANVRLASNAAEADIAALRRGQLSLSQAARQAPQAAEREQLGQEEPLPCMRLLPG